jgi:regulator of nucleoside diphosphate kinase
MRNLPVKRLVLACARFRFSPPREEWLGSNLESASAAMHHMPEVAITLADELDRAHVLKTGRHPLDVVCMGCEVEFRDDSTGKVQKVTLVYPGDADIAQGRISVLTPIGAALIGLRAGSAITWETRVGDLKRLTVLRVREPQAA